MLVALVDTLKQLRYQIAHLEDNTLQSEYPELASFIQQVSLTVTESKADLNFLYQFLYDYGRKSEATYSRFRNELERFYLWSWLIAEKSVFDLKREDIEAYVDFMVEPDKKWASTSVQWRYKDEQGVRRLNQNWRPFMQKESIASQQTLSAMFTALNVFYKFAILEEKTFAYFVPVVKKNSPYLVVQSQIQIPDTLSDIQWEYVFGVTRDLCEQKPEYERNLFTLACLKGLYLRISELSERPQWSPVMSHFWQDNDGFWFLRIMGKGNKLRDVTLSDDFLEYLDNDYSFISNILILLGLYLVIYVFGIPMTKEDKPISVRILEGIMIGLIVVTGFFVFFKYVLGIDLIDIISDVGSELSGENKEDSDDKEPEVKAGPAKEVFNIGNNNYTYKEAQAVCSVFDAEVATFDQVENAYDNGGEWCNYGWTQGQMALFPTQMSSWKKLQDFPQHKHDCGRPGINGGYFKNPYLKFGVNCYGVKPDGSDNDLNRMEANRTTPYPKSPEDKETDKKVEEWKKNKDKMLVNSFNKTIWSKY